MAHELSLALVPGGSVMASARRMKPDWDRTLGDLTSAARAGGDRSAADDQNPRDENPDRQPAQDIATR
ncbi:MAG: hypothetical protein EON93_08665 [Burkholderiales bacterium]|nr:MAG: hypothetical protein EON93_08665 [Burkholderiales bacterium]